MPAVGRSGRTLRLAALGITARTSWVAALGITGRTSGVAALGIKARTSCVAALDSNNRKGQHNKTYFVCAGLATAPNSIVEYMSSSLSVASSSSDSCDSSDSISSQHVLEVIELCRTVPTLPTFVTDCTTTTMGEGGVLAKRRLDKSLDHTTVVVRRQKTKCALHRLVGLRREGLLSYCIGCNVYLCSVCYHAFHTEKDSQNIDAEFVRQLENVSDNQRVEHQITDESLRKNGNMHQCRLDKKNIDHVPTNAKKKEACAMHAWLGFEKTKEGRGKTGATLLYCPGCKVTLCRTCYNDFHKIPDLGRTTMKWNLYLDCCGRKDSKRKRKKYQT